MIHLVTHRQRHLLTWTFELIMGFGLGWLRFWRYNYIFFHNEDFQKKWVIYELNSFNNDANSRLLVGRDNVALLVKARKKNVQWSNQLLEHFL